MVHRIWLVQSIKHLSATHARLLSVTLLEAHPGLRIAH